MVNANLIGQVAVLIGEMSKKSVKFLQQLDTVNTAMKNMQIPSHTQTQVREYLLNTQSTQDQQEELEGFLKNISPSLRFKVSVHIFSDVLKENKVISSLLKKHHHKSFIQFIVRKLEIMLTIPENEIVKQNTFISDNEKDVSLYFIAKGEFNVYVQNQVHTKPVKVRQLQVGDHFGEISMIYKCKRTATVTSNKYATLGYVSRLDYKDIVFKYQEVSSATLIKSNFMYYRLSIICANASTNMMMISSCSKSGTLDRSRTSKTSLTK